MAENLTNQLEPSLHEILSIDKELSKMYVCKKELVQRRENLEQIIKQILSSIDMDVTLRIDYGGEYHRISIKDSSKRVKPSKNDQITSVGKILRKLNNGTPLLNETKIAGDIIEALKGTDKTTHKKIKIQAEKK